MLPSIKPRQSVGAATEKGTSSTVAQRMDDAIGCQFGGQTDEDDSAEWQNVKNALEKVVSQIFTSWKQMVSWLGQLQRLRRPDSLGCAAGFQETRDVGKPVLRRPHQWCLAVGVLR